MQLIDLSQEVEYIEINPSKVPVRFSIKLDDITYQFTIRYNRGKAGLWRPYSLWTTAFRHS